MTCHENRAEPILYDFQTIPQFLGDATDLKSCLHPWKIILDWFPFGDLAVYTGLSSFHDRCAVFMTAVMKTARAKNEDWYPKMMEW